MRSTDDTTIVAIVAPFWDPLSGKVSQRLYELRVSELSQPAIPLPDWDLLY